MVLRDLVGLGLEGVQLGLDGGQVALHARQAALQRHDARQVCAQLQQGEGSVSGMVKACLLAFILSNIVVIYWKIGVAQTPQRFNNEEFFRHPYL